MTAEQWRPMPGWETYSISDRGRVWSNHTHHGTTGRILRGWRDPRTGYRRVSLVDGDGRETKFDVHRLVALAFHGSPPDGLEVRHLDGDPDNNNVTNLRYGTHAENVADTVAHGRHPMASKTHCAKGHPFDAANTRTYVRPNGWQNRVCRICSRDRLRRWRQRQALRTAGVSERAA